MAKRKSAVVEVETFICPYPDCRFWDASVHELAWHLYLEHHWKEGCLCGSQSEVAAMWGMNKKGDTYNTALATHIKSFASLAQHLEETKQIAAAREHLLAIARERRGNA